MRFELKLIGCDKVAVSFVSSKETIDLGTLSFVDCDGDVRDDVRALLAAAIVGNPLFVVK